MKVFCNGLRLAGIMLISLSGPMIAYADTSAIKQGAVMFQHGSHGIPACAGCHGAQAQGGIGPRLAGLGRAYIIRQLHAFSGGLRKSNLMVSVVRHMDEKNMQQAAAWIASREPRLSSRTPHPDSSSLKLLTTGDWSRGIPACIDCHANTLMGDGDEIPALAGQQWRYLAKRLRQLKALKSATGTPALIKSHIVSQLSDREITGLARTLASLDGTTIPLLQKQSSGGRTATNTGGKADKRFLSPPESDVPASAPLAAAVRRGEHIFMDTPEQARAYVGKDTRLSCVHCHLDRGRLATAAPMWAAAVRYPLYRKKNHKVNTLAMRIQGCFRYSLNGTAPSASSETMVDLLAYIHWLAKGLPTGIQPPAHGFPAIGKPEHTPDKTRGEKLFAMRCAMCHGMDGEGKTRDMKVLFPPLWGAHSFNWGAGMHRVDKAAAFIKANMPYGAGGSLSAQDAWDVAAFVDAHPRPEDPRFTGNAADTAARYHKHRTYDFYTALHAH